MLKKTYKDKNGIPRQALVESETSPPNEGILTSIYLDEFLRAQGFSPDFIKRLYTEMFQRGLVSPADVLSNKAPELLRAALLATIRIDVQTLQQLATEQLPNGRTNKSL